MKNSPLVEKSQAFALRVVKAYKFLKKNGETVMSKQMLRSGTSIGANIAEAQYAQSRADFSMKLTIALKEASETMYWITLLRQSDYLTPGSATQTLIADCNELISLLVASVKKVKNT